MPVIFIFSAMVSGIALIMVLYMVVSFIRKVKIDMACLDTIGKYLFYMLILDFTLESLDQVHRIYEAEESFDILHMLVNGKLYITLFGFQIILGMIIPMISLGALQIFKVREQVRKTIYLVHRPDGSDRYLFYALECGYRRTTLLQRISWIYQL